jgi:hypothetical protein
MRKIYKIKEAGAEFNRGWRWAHNMAKRGLLTLPGSGLLPQHRITAESVERLKRQAAKTGKVVRHV